MSAIELNARASNSFSAKLEHTRQLLAQTARDYAAGDGSAAPGVSLACSLGAEDMVLAHLINSAQLKIDIFVLETGMLNPETMALLEKLKTDSFNPVQVFQPVQTAVVEFVQREGKDAMYKSIELRKGCCHIRKMEPLERALKGKKAWVTGLRREQSGARAEVPFVDESDAKRVKFNPLADWTWGDVWHYIAQHQVAYNALHDQFFPSIGCAPCTRAIAMGEVFRAGRWWWEDEAAKECGLHVKTSELKTSHA
jgi:phosphoadenosine phosphosulfate reductase